MNKHTLLAAVLLYSTSSFAQSLSVEMKDLSSNQTPAP